jgi:hypothetical protein
LLVSGFEVSTKYYDLPKKTREYGGFRVLFICIIVQVYIYNVSPEGKFLPNSQNAYCELCQRRVRLNNDLLSIAPIVIVVSEALDVVSLNLEQDVAEL